MATILAHITVHSGREAEFEALARQLYADTHTHEDGVLSYQYWRGATPSTYYTLLAFPDHQTFIEHQVSPHHDAVGPGLRDVIAEMTLEWVDPIDGASPFPPTDHQDAPPNADATVSETTSLYGASVADWWAALRG